MPQDLNRCSSNQNLQYNQKLSSRKLCCEHCHAHCIIVYRNQEGIVKMSVTDLSKILKDPEQKAQYQFVDVREPAEEATANIKEFQLFPLSK